MKNTLTTVHSRYMFWSRCILSLCIVVVVVVFVVVVC